MNTIIVKSSPKIATGALPWVAPYIRTAEVNASKNTGITYKTERAANFSTLRGERSGLRRSAKVNE